MLSYNQVTNSEINNNGVSIKEIAPIMKLNLRGKTREFFTNVGKTLNMLLPTEANTSSSSDKLTAIWLSPDEWMIVSNETTSKETNTYELNDILFNNISKTSLGAVTDVTDQFVQLEIKGDKIYELFSAGCPFNFNTLDKNNSINSTYNGIAFTVDKLGENPNKVRLFALRSFGESLYHSITDASLEFGFKSL